MKKKAKSNRIKAVAKKSAAKGSHGQRTAGTARAQERTERDLLEATARELVAITADMRGLLTEIRDLLAEGLEEEEGAEAQPEEGVEAVILAETRDNEDL